MIQNPVVSGGGESVEWKDLPIVTTYAPPISKYGTASITFDEMPTMIIVICEERTDVTGGVFTTCTISNSDDFLGRITPEQSNYLDSGNNAVFPDTTATVTGNTVRFRVVVSSGGGNFYNYKYCAI